MSPRRLHPSLPRSALAGFCFPPEVIVLSVCWYLRFALSYRDVEELLAERGIEVDHNTVERRCAGSSCWRRLGVRWDRDAGRWFAFVLVACAVVCFNRR